jgi:hypothetical protein
MSDEAIVQTIKALNVFGVPYMVTGSLASNLYGIPRATKDADFVLECESLDLSRLSSLLGPSFEIDRQLSFETITSTNRHIVRVKGSHFTIDLFMLGTDPFDLERFARRKQGELLGNPIWVPTAEDVIIQKLRWSSLGRRTKDLADAHDVIAVQGGTLDWPYTERWCDVHGSRAKLDELRRSASGS